MNQLETPIEEKAPDIETQKPADPEIFSMKVFNQRQRELAVEKSFPGMSLGDLTSEERNTAMINWNRDKMSQKYRALTDHPDFRKIPRFAENGYNAITLVDVENFDLEKKELPLE